MTGGGSGWRDQGVNLQTTERSLFLLGTKTLEGCGWLFILSPPARIFTHDAVWEGYISAEVNDLNHLSENSNTDLHYCSEFFFRSRRFTWTYRAWHFLSLDPDATMLACGIINSSNATWICK